MTIDEAIKWLERIQAQDEESDRPECVKAEGLGIEALKFIADYRERAGPRTILPLKGETEE